MHSISDGYLDYFQFGMIRKDAKINTFEPNPWCPHVNISVIYTHCCEIPSYT